MEKEKIPAYRVIETFGLVCVAEFNFSEFRYKGISLGECLAETQNWLYLKEGKNERKLIWLSDDKDDYFFAPDVEIAAFIDNMALAKVKNAGFAVFNVRKTEFDENETFSHLFADKQDKFQPEGDFTKGNTFFLVVDRGDGDSFGWVSLGEKVDCPEKNVHAFWGEKVFTMLCCEEDKYFFARKKCKSFRAEEKGFILELENGTKDFFPYYQVPLEFKK